MSGSGRPESWAELLSLFRRRAELSKTALARAAGVTVSYITKLEQGQKPPPEGPRNAFAEALGLSPEETEWLHIQAELERTDPVAVRYLARLNELENRSADRPVDPPMPEEAPAEYTGRIVPIINKVAAGYPQDFTDLDYPVGVAEQYLVVPDLDDPNAFAFYVHGDSMEPDFPAGSLLIAAPNATAFDGDPCFVRFSPLARETGCTFKRVYFTSDGAVRLVPINRRYPEQRYPHEALGGCWPVVRQYGKIIRSGEAPARRTAKAAGRTSDQAS